jgi:4-diphosphocytidyl-2-C-methyl-D-erythritol kinase
MSRRIGRRLTLLAPAKVNLFLEVLGRRPDGYREIRTVMHPIGLYDRLTFRAKGRGAIELAGDTAGLGRANLIWKAARALSRRVGRPLGLRAEIRKGIPAGAGLGGGSSDAAATLRALVRLHRLALPPGALEDAAAETGSDVPFFLSSRTALCGGRGERVTALAPRRQVDFVLVFPSFALSTARVYRALSLALTRHPKDATEFVNVWFHGDRRRIGGKLFNRLEQPAFKLAPSLKKIKRRLAAPPSLGALMSGSGSALYAVAQNRMEARRTAARLAGEEGWRTIAAATADSDLEA